MKLKWIIPALWIMIPWTAMFALPTVSGGDGELVYVQPDRDVYPVSGKIRFAAFVHPATGMVTASNRVTVCLLDPTGRLVAESSGQVADNRSDGTLNLPDSLGEGEYRLVAWTNGMEKGSPENVFTRKVFIREDPFPKLFISLIPDARWYNEGEFAGVSVHITYPDNKPFANAQFVYMATRNGVPYQNGLDKTDEQGNASLTVRIPTEEAGGVLFLRIDTELGNLKGSAVIQLSAAGLPLEVTFYPEGGSLIDGQESRVGFRLRDFEGHPFEMAGVVVDAQNRFVDSIRTAGPGYGSFRIKADRKNPMRVKITQPAGMHVEYPLPAVQPEGIRLMLTGQADGRLSFRADAVNRSTPSGLTAVAECAGKEIARVPVGQNGPATFEIPVKQTDTGVIMVRLTDASGKTVANRPVIVRWPDARLKVTTDAGRGKASYLKDAVMTIEDPQGKPVGATLCLSLSDGVISPAWDREPGIRNWFWLGPAAKGLSPGYLSDPSKLTARQIDDLALSLTDTLRITPPPTGDFRAAVLRLQQPGPMEVYVSEMHRQGFFNLHYLSAGTDLTGFIRKNKSLLQSTGFIPGKPTQDDRIRQQLEIGVPILSVIRSIQPFNVDNNQIYFSKGKSSLQYPKGALIVIDGVPKGNDVSMLDYYSPHDISSIKISQKVSDILKYSADASAVILITTKNSSPAQEEEKKTAEKRYDPTLVWKPALQVTPAESLQTGLPKPAMKSTWDLVIRGIDSQGNPVEKTIRYPEWEK
jgi:hypothetical protein